MNKLSIDSQKLILINMEEESKEATTKPIAPIIPISTKALKEKITA